MRSMVLAVALVLAGPAASANDVSVDAEAASAITEDITATLPVWQPNGGEEIQFRVLRNGKRFGYHNLSFETADDGTLRVKNDIDLEVKIGPITAYKYRHQSEETWTDGQLVALDGRTRKEGKTLTVSVSSGDSGLRIDGSNNSGVVRADIIPSSHWHTQELFSDTILSSEGGQVLEIEVDRIGLETLTIGGEVVEAERYRLQSDLAVDLWYTADGRWVKCAFSARGQDIEYVLEALY
ncbi:MAG: DUF6134 family protein [Pseudomonadota bacterium]